MMPYLQAMCWYHHTIGTARLKQKSPLLVHIITDSQVTALHGNRSGIAHESLPHVGGRALWAGIRELTALGYRLQWHWAERCDSSLNYLSDLIAGLSRRAIMECNPPSDPEDVALCVKAARALSLLAFKDPATGEPISPYTLNPEENSHVGGAIAGDRPSG